MPDHSLLLGQLAEEFTTRVRAGQMPSVEGYAQRHPALAERVRALFPTLLFLEGMAGANPVEGETLPPRERGGSLESGQTFNHYRIEREVGRGGMGVVYEAVHLPLGKRVALKVLPVLAGEGSSQLERFLREARTAAGLHHTNIVPVFDIGQANGLPYYAMQYIEGRGLDRVLSESQDSERPADWFRQVAEWGIQAAEGLAYAHQRGVVHRDVKPSNLLLDGQGVLWITDFGLARRSEDVALTHSGAIVGTPRYMSPEQAEAARRPVDHRTDVYSLGATLYELLTRRPPFDGPTPVDIILQIIDREPVPPRRLDPSVPRDLETVILKGMAKRPEDRYQTAPELANDLKRWLNTEPIKARRIGPAGRTVRWARRKPAVAALTVLVIIVTICGLAGVTWKWRESEGHRLAAENEREQARDYLCRSLYDQARVVEASDHFGRRWKALALLQEAEQLRGRERRGESGVELPSREELRSVAVAALVQQDARVERNAEGHLFTVTADGRWAVCVRRLGDDGWCLRLMDLNDGSEQEVHRWQAREWPRLALALSRDGKQLAAVGVDGPGVWLWELPDGKRRQLSDPGGSVKPTILINDVFQHLLESIDDDHHQLLFSPDGGHLALCQGSGPYRQLLVWDLPGGTTSQPCLNLLDRGARGLNGLFAFSPDGERIAHLTEDGIVLQSLREPDGRTVLKHRVEVSPEEKIVGARFAFSPTQPLLVSALVVTPRTDRILLWDLAKLQQLGQIEMKADAAPQFAFSPDGKQLAVGSGSEVRVFATDGLREVHRFTVPDKDPVAIEQLAWHPDGRRLVTVSFRTLIVWEPTWQRAAGTIPIPPNPEEFAFSPDGQWLAVTDPRLSTSIWLIHRATGSRRELKWGHGEFSTPHYCFRHDSKQLGLVGSKQALVYEVETGKRLIARDLPVKTLEEVLVAFSPEGDFLVLPMHKDRVDPIWNVTTGEWLPRLQSDERDDPKVFYRARISPDRRRLVGSWGGKARAPEVAQLLRMRMLSGERSVEVKGAGLGALSPDGRLLAVGYTDGSAQLWEVESGQLRFHWQPHIGLFLNLKFTPDGDSVMSTDRDSPEVKVLHLPTLRRQLAEIGLDW